MLCTYSWKLFGAEDWSWQWFYDRLSTWWHANYRYMLPFYFFIYLYLMFCYVSMHMLAWIVFVTVYFLGCGNWWWFVSAQTLLSTFLLHCNGLNSIRAIQTGLSRTFHGLCRKHLDTSRWFLSATFVICVHDFPHEEISVKVGIMEFQH